MRKASALGLRKAMLPVPPPMTGATARVSILMVVVSTMFCPAIALRRTLFGSSRMACVIVPAAMKLERSCGILGVGVLVAVWEGNRIFAPAPLLPMGVMSTGGITGGPGFLSNVPWALIVVPCGMEAIRTTVTVSPGADVLGTMIQRPGSRWMPVGFAGSVMSLMDCR